MGVTMGGCHTVKAHKHELIARRVETAINKATDDIVLMLTERGCTDEGLRAEVLDIIMRHAYYGDKLTNGEISDDALASIREFAAA